jgi:hypothetical protein
VRWTNSRNSMLTTQSSIGKSLSNCGNTALRIQREKSSSRTTSKPLSTRETSSRRTSTSVRVMQPAFRAADLRAGSHPSGGVGVVPALLWGGLPHPRRAAITVATAFPKRLYVSFCLAIAGCESAVESNLHGHCLFAAGEHFAEVGADRSAGAAALLDAEHVRTQPFPQLPCLPRPPQHILPQLLRSPLYAILRSGPWSVSCTRSAVGHHAFRSISLPI